MYKRRFAFSLALLFVFAAFPVHAYMGPPSLSPSEPVAGQIVSVIVPYGLCDAIPEQPVGFPQITIAGSAIQILFFTIHVDDSEECFLPIYSATVPLGGFPAGNYTVQVDAEYNNGSITVYTVGVLPLTVRGAATPIGAPTLGILAEMIIALLICALACVTIRRRRGGMPVLALAVLVGSGIGSVRAQVPSPPPTIEVMLPSAMGAPTPDAVVAYFAQSPRPPNPPLQSLKVGNPESAAYLMPRRAAGDFLAHLQAYPNSPRAMMERYVIVTYPAATNLQNALAALRADSQVQAAYIAGPGNFSSVDLQSFGIGGEEPLTSTQYGRADLNIDAAWQLAGGYVLVGDVNTGLYQLHPALVRFSASGQYVGGNFIPIESLDIGQATTFNPPNFIESNVDELNPVQVTRGGPCDTNGTGYAIPIAAGHGTHVAGLIAANASAGLGVAGTCKHCGIAMWKVTSFSCIPPATQPYPIFNSDAAVPRSRTSRIQALRSST